MTLSRPGRLWAVRRSLRCAIQRRLLSPWLLIAFAKLAIEALSTVHATDFKADEVEIGIVSTSEDEDEKTRGLWRTLSEEELDEHLSAYVEKD
jgi:hypothetical protein